MPQRLHQLLRDIAHEYQTDMSKIAIDRIHSGNTILSHGFALC